MSLRQSSRFKLFFDGATGTRHGVEVVSLLGMFGGDKGVRYTDDSQIQGAMFSVISGDAPQVGGD